MSDSDSDSDSDVINYEEMVKALKTESLPVMPSWYKEKNNDRNTGQIRLPSIIEVEDEGSLFVKPFQSNK